MFSRYGTNSLVENCLCEIFAYGSLAQGWCGILDPNHPQKWDPPALKALARNPAWQPCGRAGLT